MGKLSEVESFDKMHNELNFKDYELESELNLFISIHDFDNIDDDCENCEIRNIFDYWLAERYNWDIKLGKFK